MTLSDACGYRTQIRRSCWKAGKYIDPNKSLLANINIEDFYADDWEVYEDRITISKSDFYKALSEALKEEFNNRFSFSYYGVNGIETDPQKVVQNMCEYTNWKTLVNKLFGEKK